MVKRRKSNPLPVSDKKIFSHNSHENVFVVQTREGQNYLSVALDLLDQVRRGHAVFLHHDVSGGRHTKLVHAHDLAIKARVLVPQRRHSRLKVSKAATQRK